MSKIALGTAQFGMDYGINNSRGKIPRQEVFDILNKAFIYGIETLDTAFDYGESENIIGDFIKTKSKKFNIISKLPKCDPEEVSSIVSNSLSKLGVENFYGYLIHNYDHFNEDPACWKALKILKSKGLIQKIGFSLYYPQELNSIFENSMEIDMVQIPYNILDQRFIPYLPKLKESGVEIYVRSVFLQGLLFKKPRSLSSYFSSIKRKISDLHAFADNAGMPLVAILYNFAAINRFVDKVIIGIDSLQNLNGIIEAPRYSKGVSDVFEQLYDYREDDENIILPFKWKESVN